MLRRSLFLALLAIMGTSAPVWGAGECAFYISTRFEEDPDSGYLLGESTRKTSGYFKSKWGPVETQFEQEETFQVGYYQMESGRRIEVDCRTYEQIG